MMEININEAGSYYNLPALKKVWNESWKVEEISIEFDTNSFPNEKQPDTWPFKAILSDDNDKIIIRIFSLSVGYAGTGPHDLANILDWLKVKYNEDEIFTKIKMGEDGWIRLKYHV